MIMNIYDVFVFLIDGSLVCLFLVRRAEMEGKRNVDNLF